MKLVATTVIRHSVVGQEATGQMVVIDWKQGEIERVMPVPLPEHPKLEHQSAWRAARPASLAPLARLRSPPHGSAAEHSPKGAVDEAHE